MILALPLASEGRVWYTTPPWIFPWLIFPHCFWRRPAWSAFLPPCTRRGISMVRSFGVHLGSGSTLLEPFLRWWEWSSRRTCCCSSLPGGDGVVLLGAGRVREREQGLSPGDLDLSAGLSCGCGLPDSGGRDGDASGTLLAGGVVLGIGGLRAEDRVPAISRVAAGGASGGAGAGVCGDVRRDDSAWILRTAGVLRRGSDAPQRSGHGAPAHGVVAVGVGLGRGAGGNPLCTAAAEHQASAGVFLRGEHGRDCAGSLAGGVGASRTVPRHGGAAGVHRRAAPRAEPRLPEGGGSSWGRDRFCG